MSNITLKTKREKDFWERAFLEAARGQYAFITAMAGTVAVREVEFGGPQKLADDAVVALRARMPEPGTVPEVLGE